MLTNAKELAVEQSKSNRAISAPYRLSIDLGVRFFPFREVIPTEKAVTHQPEIESCLGGRKTDQRMFKRRPFENVA